MVRHVAVFILGLSIAFAQKQKEETRPQKPESTVTAIPAGAAEASPGLFKQTDREGKTWLYRKTPFGVVKSSDDAPVASAQPAPTSVPRANPFGDDKTTAAATPSVTAVEDGDSYKFERNTPFGPTRWTRKKSELTADEQEIVQRLRKPKSDTTGSKE